MSDADLNQVPLPDDEISTELRESIVYNSRRDRHFPPDGR